jgi:hypothetical protein
VLHEALAQRAEKPAVLGPAAGAPRGHDRLERPGELRMLRV